jgi:hypothetical protein
MGGKVIFLNPNPLYNSLVILHTKETGWHESDFTTHGYCCRDRGEQVDPALNGRQLIGRGRQRDVAAVGRRTVVLRRARRPPTGLEARRSLAPSGEVIFTRPLYIFYEESLRKYTGGS